MIGCDIDQIACSAPGDPDAAVFDHRIIEACRCFDADINRIFRLMEEDESSSTLTQLVSNGPLIHESVSMNLRRLALCSRVTCGAVFLHDDELSTMFVDKAKVLSDHIETIVLESSDVGLMEKCYTVLLFAYFLTGHYDRLQFIFLELVQIWYTLSVQTRVGVKLLVGHTSMSKLFREEELSALKITEPEETSLVRSTPELWWVEGDGRKDPLALTGLLKLHDPNVTGVCYRSVICYRSVLTLLQDGQHVFALTALIKWVDIVLPQVKRNHLKFMGCFCFRDLCDLAIAIFHEHGKIEYYVKTKRVLRNVIKQRT